LVVQVEQALCLLAHKVFQQSQQLEAQAPQLDTLAVTAVLVLAVNLICAETAVCQALTLALLLVVVVVFMLVAAGTTVRVTQHMVAVAAATLLLLLAV
jgi:hypothetical protein